MNDTAIGLLTYKISDPALEAAAGPYNDDPLHEDFGPKKRVIHR
jgi:hypothetical protein